MANKVKKILVFTMMLFVGISSVLASTKNISVTNIEVKDKSGTITVVDPVFESDEIKSNIMFNQKDDFVTFELTLKNNESEKYKIESVTDNNTNENIKVDYNYDNNFIAPGETTKITLKLTYKKQLLNVDQVSLNDLTITINLENEAGEDEEIIINPVTGDNIFHYLVLLIIALTGIGLLIAKKKFKGIKVGSLVIILAAVLLPFTVFANEKYEVKIKFDDIIVKGEFETYNITIDKGNGSAIETRQVKYGDPIGALPTSPTKTGYNFSKWTDAEGNEVTKDTIITGPIDVIASYTIITYNITYNLDSGSLPSGKTNPEAYTIESQSITLNNPEKQGYTFTGWTGTGIDTETTSVTIAHGSTGDRDYQANYSANDNTEYKVIHKFANLNGGYDDEVVVEHGTTGTTVPAPRKTRTGFITPVVQNVYISADGKAEITYTYERETYSFSIPDRTYIDETVSTPNDSYPYETLITVKALEREGYEFTWSDGDTNYQKTFNLTGITSIAPIYTAKTNTPYTVEHYKMDIGGQGYTIADTQELTGKTDDPVTPAVNTYEGFISPATQSTTIGGDGKTVVKYYYTRKQATVTMTNTDYIVEGDLSGPYYYDEQITLTAKTRDGYTFTGWTTGETTNSITVTVGENNINVGPEYTANTNTHYTVNHYKMNLDGQNYTIELSEDKTGTTDAPITPAVNTYDGFTSPSTQSTTISGKGDTVVNYYYTRNQYTLTITNSQFVVEDKSGPYYYDAEISLTAIDRQGYTFTGWNTGESTKSITFKMPVNGITVEPLYTANTDTTYSITHKYRKLTTEEEYDIVTVNGTGTTGDTIVAPLRPVTGFDNPQTQNITILPSGDANVTYTYQRTMYTFTITDRNYLDNTSTPNGTYPYGTTITLKAIEREGYTFKWSDDVTDLERSFEISENVTNLSLVYTANTYTLTADANTGSITEATGWTISGTIATKDIAYDSTYGLLPTVTKQGYSLIKWNTKQDGTGTTIDSATPYTTADNQTVYAVWEANTNTPYTVKHYKMDIDGQNYTLAETEDKTGTTDTNVTATTRTYTGFTAPATQTKKITGDGNMLIEYYYTRNQYDVTFDTDGGTTITKQTIYHGGTATRPATDPTKEGYNFIGWYTDKGYQTAFDFSDPIVGPTTVCAYFEENTYTVTFDTDGGSSVPSQTITYGGTATRPAENPTKTNYTFVNWYTTNQYQTTFDFSTPITSDTTIYAKFELNTYTVTFDEAGGDPVTDITVDAGDSIDELPTPTRTDYYFVGWFENESDTTPVIEPYTPSGDIELIAKWQKIVCKKATTLTETVCHSGSGSGCRLAGYADGDKVVFGNVVSSDTYNTGDALLCDVDGTGYNTRFYYMRTLDDKAVLISANTVVASGDSHDTNYLYDDAKNLLPTASEWSNLPVTFENGTKAGRFPTLEDSTAAFTGVNIEDNNALKDYTFIFEDLAKYNSGDGRSTVWLKEVDANNRYRYHINSNNVAKVTGTVSTSKNCVKPVIEVPYYLIEDAYIIRFNANGGEASSEYAKVIKGNAIGTLPTATRSGTVFGGWYTSLQYTIPVNENTIPNGYVTYYAKWETDIADATFAYDSFVLEIGDEDDIEITTPNTEEVTYTSNDDNVVIVDSSGHLLGLDVGETTITVTGTKSGHTRTINIKVLPEVTDFTVHFDSQGGSSVADMNVPKNTAIGSFPADPVYTGYIFAGWFTNTNYSTQVTVDTVIKSEVTFFAKWIPEDAVAEINHTYYTTLQAAIDDAPTTKTTVKLLKNVEVTTPIDMINKNTNKDIILDLNGYTLSTGSSAPNKTNVIKNKAKLEVKNGTISSSKNDALINVEGTNSYLVLRDNITLISTGGRACVYNNGGNALIEGNASLTSNAEWTSSMKRGTVQTLNNGITTIKGGTIINNRSSASYAVAIELGTVTIGTEDGIYDTQNLIMQGETNGIYAEVDFSLYDGLVKGKTAAVNNESKITSIEENATKVNDVDGNYNILYYTVPVSKYRIDLDAGDGTVDPEYILVDAGDQLGTLPTPTRGVYTFDGWFDANDVQADSTHTPTGNETYYAKWHYEASNEIVTFRTTNDAMIEYYDKIETWKVSSSNFPSWSSSNKSPDWALDATENTAMKNNFDDNNCQCADGQCTSSGTVECDKPKGYVTGLNEKINVYLSDEITKTKGDLVTYAKSNSGVIYNLIPGEVYYWESDNDSSIHGYVKFTGERRILDTGDVRNTRDLGGLPVDTNSDGTIDGELKYGKLFRGIKLNSSSSVTELSNLGITEELDLREANSDQYKLSDITGKKYHRIEAQNYYVNYNLQNQTEMNYYNMTRAAVKYAMEEIVNGENLYFHCRIGTDRTGTVAYVLEGLLGVPEEDRIQDYELSFFYGLIRLHRYHNEKPGSSVGTGKERFVYMHNFMPTNSDIYSWYMAGSTNQQDDIDLINAFRNAMINYN